MGLGEKVVATLSKWWEVVSTGIFRVVFPHLYDLLEELREMQGKKIEQADPGIAQIMRSLGLPEDNITAIHGALQKVDPKVRYLLLPGFYIGTILSYLTNLFEVSSIPTKQKLLSIFLPRLPFIEQAITAFFRGKVSPAELSQIASRWGLTQHHLDDVIAAQRNILDPQSIRDASLRGLFSDGATTQKLAALGFESTDIEILKKLFFFIPPAQDLIRMAVREAFTPEIAEKFGQYEDFPPDFAKYAAQQGISSEWAKRYWAAHWDLPSVLHGYEMLHRNVISEADLKMLMRALDIMPWWRDKLIQISYAPFTRVDVRRMYNTGVLSVPEVKRAYMDIGYTAEKAEKLTQFTIALNTEKDRDLTKADLIDGFSRGLTPEAEALDLLESMGYSDREARFYLERAKLKNIEAKKKQVITNTQKRFKAGVISADEATRRLIEAGVTQREIDELFSLWEISKDEEVYTPTVGDLKALLKAGIIEEAVFTSEMQKKGAEPKYISWLIALVTKGAE